MAIPAWRPGRGGRGGSIAIDSFPDMACEGAAVVRIEALALAVRLAALRRLRDRFRIHSGFPPRRRSDGGGLLIIVVVTTAKQFTEPHTRPFPITANGNVVLVFLEQPRFAACGCEYD